LKTKYCTVTDKVTSEKVKVKGAYKKKKKYRDRKKAKPTKFFYR